MSRDRNTVTEWVDEYGDALFNYAMAQTNDRELCLDLIQETYIAALKSVDSFEGRSSPKTWLISILRRKMIDHWRKQKSRKTYVASHYFTDEDDRSPGHWIVDNAPSSTIDEVAEKVELEEQIAALEECLDTLPSRSRSVVRAKYLEQKKGAEICKDFDLTSSNFWVIIHRAKLVLRDCLQSKYKDE